MVPTGEEPVSFVTGSDSEHCVTFHMQKIDAAAHELQPKYVQKLECTSEYLGSILGDEELEDFLKRSNWAVRMMAEGQRSNICTFACRIEVPEVNGKFSKRKEDKMMRHPMPP